MGRVRCGRNAVEDIFGTAKTAYGLARISAQLQEIAVCVIGVALLLLNLSRSLRLALALFFSCLCSLFCQDCGVGPTYLLPISTKMIKVGLPASNFGEQSYFLKFTSEKNPQNMGIYFAVRKISPTASKIIAAATAPPSTKPKLFSP